MDLKTVWSELAELRQKQANCERELSMLRADLTQLLSHINENLIGMRRELAATQAELIGFNDAGQGSIQALREALHAFNGSELADLAADMGVTLEELPGDTLPDKRRELVAYMERRGRLCALLARCQQLRPEARWGG